MMTVHNRPVFTDIFDSVDEFVPAPASVYISGHSVEARSEHVGIWKERAKDVQFVNIVREERNSIDVKDSSGRSHRLALRSQEQLRRFWNQIQQPVIYFDTCKASISP